MSNANLYHCSREESLLEYLDKNLSSHKLSEFEQHLRDCSICRDSLEEMEQIGELLTSREREQPTTAFLSQYHSSLGKMFTPAHTPARDKLTELLNRIIFPKPTGFRIAQAVALLAIGIFIGSAFLDFDGVETTFPTGSDIVVLSVTPEDADYMSTFLTKSEILLLAVVNTDDGSDLSFNKSMAQNLLLQTDTMAEKISQVDNQSMEVFLNRLELILLEMSNMDLQSGVYNLAELREKISEKQMLAESQRYQEILQTFEDRSL